MSKDKKQRLAEIIVETKNNIDEQDIAELYLLLQNDDARINYDELFRDFYSDSKDK